MIAFVLMLLLGCTKDTCAGGDNMSSPRLKGGFEAQGEEVFLTILWDKGTKNGSQLPDAYFASPEVSCYFDDANHKECPMVQKVRLERFGVWKMTFVKEELAKHKGKALRFSIRMPDRRDHMECNHFGMDDFYSLMMKMELDENGKIVSSSFGQLYVPGAF